MEDQPATVIGLPRPILDVLPLAKDGVYPGLLDAESLHGVLIYEEIMQRLRLQPTLDLPLSRPR